MVIGEKFAWGHLGRTGGDATLDLFAALPDLIRFADPVSSEEKHTPFRNRESAIRGKLLALNIRRLPAWALSRAHHRARFALGPDYDPQQMLSPHQIVESTEADQLLLAFTDNGKLKIDRWLRAEFLVDDFLTFVSEFTEVSESKRQEILELASTRRGTSLVYDHEIDHWFSRDQIQAIYENNPVWADFERQLYGAQEPPVANDARGSKPGRRPRARVTARISSRLKAPRHLRGHSRPMTKRELLARRAQGFVEKRLSQAEGWEGDPSELDRANHERQIALVDGRRYRNVLELGCRSGFFTRRLADIADRVIALDVAPSAIARARTLGLDRHVAEFRLASPMEYDVRADGPWDLVVMSETIYDYCWLYPLFDVGWLATELFAATRDGGRFLMANTYGAEEAFGAEHVLSPWLINTYRDLFLNVGYRREAEEIGHGTKDAIEYKTLITLFAKPGGGSETTGFEAR